ncbi:HAD hydrolase-like protein [Erysipelothrix sp. HDW6A]|uniref:HAD hydrolase-like protein n=1 Tax=Erysipelothrix sp. HDW6A TaxID=2714928 RepID=UPI00140A8A4E|nr:HAD hydrolase-like protein [Erysipelothrix sp. HDW6A]QIK57276.1 HAD hydrolase-like protein [Erysipelothrix sp. HDW6A]
MRYNYIVDGIHLKVVLERVSDLEAILIQNLLNQISNLLLLAQESNIPSDRKQYIQIAQSFYQERLKQSCKDIHTFIFDIDALFMNIDEIVIETWRIYLTQLGITPSYSELKYISSLNFDEIGTLYEFNITSQMRSEWSLIFLSFTNQLEIVPGITKVIRTLSDSAYQVYYSSKSIEYSNDQKLSNFVTSCFESIILPVYHLPKDRISKGSMYITSTINNSINRIVDAEQIALALWTQFKSNLLDVNIAFYEPLELIQTYCN